MWWNFSGSARHSGRMPKPFTPNSPRRGRRCRHVKIVQVVETVKNVEVVRTAREKNSKYKYPFSENLAFFRGQKTLSPLLKMILPINHFALFSSRGIGNIFWQNHFPNIGSSICNTIRQLLVFYARFLNHKIHKRLSAAKPHPKF